jgi:hypothetical protein
MPPKRTPKRKSVPRSPKRKPITDELLESALNVLLVVDTQKKTYTGRLIRYDDEAIVLAPKTCIPRAKILAFLEARNAPAKEVSRPAVRGHGDDGT